MQLWEVQISHFVEKIKIKSNPATVDNFYFINFYFVLI